MVQLCACQRSSTMIGKYAIYLLSQTFLSVLNSTDSSPMLFALCWRPFCTVESWSFLPTLCCVDLVRELWINAQTFSFNPGELGFFKSSSRCISLNASWKQIQVDGVYLYQPCPHTWRTPPEVWDMTVPYRAVVTFNVLHLFPYMV